MKVGSKVLMINDVWDYNKPYYDRIKLPLLGEIYTVRKIKDTNEPHSGIWLNEIVNPQLDFGGKFCEAGWYAWRFIQLLPPIKVGNAESIQLGEDAIIAVSYGDYWNPLHPDWPKDDLGG